MRFLYILACLHGTLAALIPPEGRALTDVFGGLDAPDAPAPAVPAEHPLEHPATTAHAAATQAITLGSLLTGIEQATKTGSKTSATHSQTSSIVSPTTYSVIGSIPPLPSYSPYSKPSASASSPAPAASLPATTNHVQAAESPSRATKSWEIVGVAVTAFTVVSAILLLSVFFDHWWSFIRDLVWKKPRKDRFEEFIPDWEQASWEVKMDKSAADRYPSFAGPPRRNQVKHAWQEKFDWVSGENMAGVGAGLTPSSRQEPTPSQCSSAPTWSLGFVTPVPPPPALHTDFRAQERNSKFDRRKSRVVSTAFSDVDPYAGIE
ncbi:hypothetical protein EIP86_003310 [Pleurotus ostreatoroseus]|nr:hypothetical protein EIP86_003310 [Pleurotus ostreatoroseus]